jgi:hypothetical protein
MPADSVQGPGPHHQVEMVGHQAVAQQVDQARGGVGHGPEKGVVIGGLMEHDRAAVAAIEDVIPTACDRDSCGSWHRLVLPQPIRRPHYSFCSLFRPLFPVLFILSRAFLFAPFSA